MNLVLDLGNTNVKWAILRDNKIIDYEIIRDFSLLELSKIRLKYPNINHICCAKSGVFSQSIEKFCKEFIYRSNSGRYNTINYFINFYKKFLFPIN